MVEVCAALALRAPKAAVTPVPWVRWDQQQLPVKLRSMKIFLWVPVHFSLFLHLSNTNWKTQKF